VVSETPIKPNGMVVMVVFSNKPVIPRLNKTWEQIHVGKDILHSFLGEKAGAIAQWAHPKQPSMGINSRIRLHGRTWTKNCQGPANVMKTMMRSLKKITFVADMARNMGSVLAFRV